MVGINYKVHQEKPIASQAAVATVVSSTDLLDEEDYPCIPHLKKNSGNAFCIVQVFIGNNSEWQGHPNSINGFRAGQWINALYALSHGYHYCLYTEPLQKDNRKPHWQKVLAVRHTLQQCPNVLLLDTDAAIRDFDQRLEPVFEEFLGVRTGKHMALAVDWPLPWCFANTGVVFYKAHPVLDAMLDFWYSSPLKGDCDPYFLLNHAYEQACFVSAVYPKYSDNVQILQETFISGQGMFVRHIYWYGPAAGPFWEQLHDLLRNYSVPSVLGAYRLLPHLRRAPRNAGAVSRLRLPRHRHPNVTQWCLAVKRANRERNLGCGGVAPNVLHYTAPCPVR
eukprot:EG_transcript_18173